MDIVKKNIVSIIFGVIVIIAIIADFYPFSGYITDLQSEATKREAAWKKAKDLYSKHHTLPSTSLNHDAQPIDLGVFPEPKITNDVRAYMNSLVSQSKAVFLKAVDLNKTECAIRPDAKDDVAKLLLVPDCLPVPKGSQDDEFKKALSPELERLRTVVLNGSSPPTAEELTKATTDLAAVYDKKRIKDASGAAYNEADVVKALADATALLPQQMRDKVALEHTMYVDPLAIVLPADFAPTNPTPPSAEKMFYAQAALWAEEDICRAIAEVNHGAKNVTEAPVKRLLRLDPPYGPAIYLRPGGTDQSGGGVTAMSSGASTPSRPPPLPSEKQDYSQTPTGRTCNTLYDVVNITLDVHIDATKVPQLLSELSRNRLVTVRNIIGFGRVDNSDMLQQGFVYGSAPIADLVLDIEMLQMREWTVQYMPLNVKNLVGGAQWVSELAAPGANPAPAGPVPAAAPAASPGRLH